MNMLQDSIFIYVHHHSCKYTLTSNARSKKKDDNCARNTIIGIKTKVLSPLDGFAIHRVGVNFTNILRAPFSYKSLLSSFSVDKLRFDFFWRKDIGAKAARKTLVKLTKLVGRVKLTSILDGRGVWVSFITVLPLEREKGRKTEERRFREREKWK